jgi:hypothetical protein
MSGLFGAIACSLVYLSARLLGLRRPAACLAALGLGVSATFWSQAIIADVYSLNAMLFFALLLLALSAGREAAAGSDHGRLADGSALIAGLGVANHWPLLLLSAPGLMLLWWPVWRTLLRRLPVMLVWFCVGLLPYAWLVWRSQMYPEISFQGSINSWREFVDYVLRHGYVGVDDGAAAGVWDKLLYLSFLVRQAGSQLLLPGAALALIGFFRQWRHWGRLTAWALTLAFLGPTLLLTFLLNLDYDPLRREAFRVYPVAAWGILALWAGLGLHIAVERLPVMWRRPAAASAVAVTVLAVATAHWARNDRSGEWLGRDRAEAMLAQLTANAVLLLRADLDTPTTAYLHLIERRRPDVTLVSEQALVLEPRLFDPYRTPKAAQRQVIDAYVQHVGRPVYRTFNGDPRPGTVSWLLFRLDTSSGPGASERHFRFLAEECALLRRIVQHGPFQDGWNEFLRRYLFESFARFQTMAELAGEWPGAGDPGLAQMVETVLKLPEAALMRASVLSNADALGHAD